VHGRAQLDERVREVRAHEAVRTRDEHRSTVVDASELLAEIVENPLPKDRKRNDFHKHPLYYATRNHIIDFLVSRSRTFIQEAGRTYDARHVVIVRPGLPEPTIATAQESSIRPTRSQQVAAS